MEDRKSKAFGFQHLRVSLRLIFSITKSKLNAGVDFKSVETLLLFNSSSGCAKRYPTVIKIIPLKSESSIRSHFESAVRLMCFTVTLFYIIV